MSGYMTKQRLCLLDFLKNHADEMLSAHTISEALREKKISVSAVYRNLALFEADGIVVKETSRDGNESLYRYIDPEHCKDALHLSCKKCGRTFHMEDDAARALEAVVAKVQSFALDKNGTVIYGVCNDCQ